MLLIAITTIILFTVGCTARTCSFLPDDGCDVTAITQSPCFADTYAHYLEWQTALSACDCEAYDENLQLVSQQDNCVNVKCAPSDSGCALGCVDAYNAARSAVSARYCSCYFAANSICSSTTRVTTTTSSTTSTSATNSSSTTFTEPAPPPSTPFPPPTSPLTCDYQYISGTSCPANGASANCLQQGKALVQLSSPTTNGCGPAVAGTSFFDYLKILLHAGLSIVGSEFTACCDIHDQCYGTCSGGNDYLFDSCNSQFYSCMQKTCNQYASSLSAIQAPGPAANYYENCLARAVVFYQFVQHQGCDPYDSAQNSACTCVDCTVANVIGGPSKLAVKNAVQSVCSSAENISNDWSGFTTAINAAIFVANPIDQQSLGYYASVVGAQDSTTSSQIRTVTLACGQAPQRRYNRRSDLSSGPTHNPRRPMFQAVAYKRALALSSYFTDISDTDLSTYTCGANASDAICSASLALVTIAGLSRQIEAYAGDNNATTSSSPSISPSSSSSSHSSLSSSLTISSLSFLSTSSASPADTNPSSTSSLEGVEPTSPVGAASTSTVLSSSGDTSVTATSLLTPTTVGSPPSIVATSSCKLVKHFGDSPDTPDSPDGEPEIPEIPDYPGGYYYLCEDGSIPALSELPAPYGLATTVGTADITSAVPRPTIPPTESSSSVISAECTQIWMSGDSPDTADTPDSPDGQPEIPEISETPQDYHDPAHYLTCSV